MKRLLLAILITLNFFVFQASSQDNTPKQNPDIAPIVSNIDPGNDPQEINYNYYYISFYHCSYWGWNWCYPQFFIYRWNDRYEWRDHRWCERSLWQERCQWQWREHRAIILTDRDIRKFERTHPRHDNLIAPRPQLPRIQERPLQPRSEFRPQPRSQPHPQPRPQPQRPVPHPSSHGGHHGR